MVEYDLKIVGGTLVDRWWNAGNTPPVFPKNDSQR